ncbi:MAG: hypothetical protein WC350_00080 [Candidatus Micrarchaeia archaeon]|jgi:cytochrome c biogenesis protein CcdA/glutaredoxin
MFKRILPALILLSLAFSIDVTMYYGVGCPHCARTEAVFQEIGAQYNLEINQKEIYQNSQNRAEMFAVYERFGQDPAEGGVPTILVENSTMIIGELEKYQWEALFALCQNSSCPAGVYTKSTIDSVSPLHEQDPTTQLTWGVLIGAALVDSINPCTLAVMTMLLGMILISDGRKRMLLSSVVFISVVFFMYLLFGLGILQALATPGITDLFFKVVTVGALLLSIMEINAYINYKPGFLAVEMPVFLRPYTHKVIEGATSLPGVAVAALFCSIFLLPCSSGPYLMVLAMVSQAVTLQTLTYLLVYNLVFILPMIIITLAVYSGYTTVEKVGDAKDKYIRQIHLVSGVILFLLFLFMLNEWMHFF